MVASEEGSTEYVPHVTPEGKEHRHLRVDLDDHASSPEGCTCRRYPRSADGDRLLETFLAVVEPIGLALPNNVEVVLHDLSKLPNSIVAVYGEVTGRRPGDPATDLLLKRAGSGTLKTETGYETLLPDGRRLKSSTTIIRDVAGNPTLALCVNSDLSAWQAVARLAADMIGGEPMSAEPAPRMSDGVVVHESFMRDVDELAATLLHEAVMEAGVPVERMQKRHKIEVVRTLKPRGMFLLRDAVEMVAEALQVSRFTIYNYLNEVAEEEGDADSTAGTAVGQ